MFYLVDLWLQYIHTNIYKHNARTDNVQIDTNMHAYIHAYIHYYIQAYIHYYIQAYVHSYIHQQCLSTTTIGAVKHFFLCHRCCGEIS